jgi:biopolymer transport protein ExbB
MLVSSLTMAWWNDDWSGRKAFVLDTSAAGGNLTETLSEVPLLLRLHSGNFPAFFEVADGGRDFRFFADDEVTPLKHHVESFDPINELAFVWVKMPQLLAGSNAQKIWMYYGNVTAPPAADAAGSFDVAQTLAVHFDPDLGLPTDATAYANHPSSVSSETLSSSYIGAGARFDAGSQMVFPASPSLAISPATGWTFSAWIKPQQAEGQALLLSMLGEQAGLQLRLAEGGLEAAYRLPEQDETVVTGGQLSPGAWHHVALVATADSLAVFVDGEMRGQTSIALLPIEGELIIGALGEATGFVGEIDEIRVANVARSAAWLSVGHKIQGGDSVVSAQADETQGGGESGGPTSFFGTILSNISTDGWVVIGLLSVMSVLSWVVMVMKTMSLNRIAIDNQSFMERFKTLDPSQPDELDQSEAEEDRELAGSPILQALFGSHDHYQSSNIYHVYHIGMTEMNKRLGRSVGAQASLSERALAAIRSAMDAATVRETQKLNSLMVMLTIAISGGPFLGLLGTVMGVMITFAAIAVTGDVNIDAIAPGVSAALMTTVAGLFVAIPALFGYNYLAIRIRDMTADMYVFVDELEAKIGEFHA